MGMLFDNIRFCAKNKTHSLIESQRYIVSLYQQTRDCRCSIQYCRQLQCCRSKTIQKLY